MPPAPRELATDLSRERRSAQCVTRFPDGGETSALANDARPGREEFVVAMKAAGVAISSTRRPAERAYPMHDAWRVNALPDPPPSGAPVVS